MIVLVDAEDRENEGDLVCAAEKVTPQLINFMARFGRGLICLPLTSDKCDALGLYPQTLENTARFGTAFTVSVDAAEGITTGISAADRAHTIQVAIAEGAKPKDLARPGHVFPLRARTGGVLVRAGQTEGTIDLARLAGLQPAGVICEIMNEDGSMARVPELLKFCKQHGLKMLKKERAGVYCTIEAGETKQRTKPLQVLQSLLPVVILQCRDQLVHIACHYLVQTVERQINPMVGNTILREIVGPDLL